MNPWIQEDFGRVDLGDPRLNRRRHTLVQAFSQKPNLSPKAACGGWAETLAAYRFFDHERVSAEKIFAPHRQAILQRIQAYGGQTVLCVQDTTELQVTFELKAKPADPKQKKPARSARLVVQEVRACTVELQAPRDKEPLGPIRVTVISARELYCPEGEEPIHWILVSSLEVRTLAEASEILGYYLVGWEIEVFHKILKSGCTVEKLQFERIERLLPCLAVYMIIAWRIHFLTKLGRDCPQLPCSLVYEEAEGKAVVYILKGPQAVHTEPSLGEFNPLVGQLGGHLNRKSDGWPGPQSMWRGLERVRQWALCWGEFGPG